MIEELKKRKILDKLLNKDFNFDDEQQFIILENDDLQEKILEILNNMYHDITDENINYFLNNKDFLLLLDLVNEDLYESSNQIVKFYYFLYNCTQYIISYPNLLEFLSNNIEDEKIKEKIIELYYHFLKTNNYKVFNIFDLETLNILLKLEQHDLISKANINISLDKNTLDILRDRNITLEIPSHRVSSYEDNLKILSFDSLLCLIEEKKDFTNEILNELDKYLENKKSLRKIDFSHQWNIIFNIIPINYEDKIIDFLVKKYDKFTFDLSISSYPIKSMPNIILDKLLEKGKISLISMTDKMELYLEKIVELINKKTDMYKNELIIIDSMLENHHKLLECCLENGIPFKFFKSYLKNKEDSYCEIVTNLLKQRKLNINSETFRFFCNQELFNLILDTNEVQIFNYIENYNTILTFLNENNINSFCNIIKNNLKFASNLFETESAKIISNPVLLKTYLSLSKNSLSKIIDYLNHNEALLDTFNKKYLEIIYENILESTNLNKNHLNELKNRFGYHIIRYFQNENIINLINLDDLSFEKVLKLFSDTKYTITNLQKSYDSINQYKFSLENPKILSIFNNILKSIDNNNYHYLEHLDELKKVMDNKFYDYFCRYYPNFDKHILSSNDLLLFIVENIKYGDYQAQVFYKEVLHKITTYYIDRMRGDYQKKTCIYDDIKLPYDLEPASLQNALLNSYINNLTNDLIKLMRENGYEIDLAIAVITYYSTHKISNFSKYDQKTISSNVGKMVKIAKQGLEKYLNESGETIYQFLITSLDSENKIKRIYKIPENNLNNIYKILSELNIDILKRHLLDNKNDAIYNSLLNILKDNKVYLLPNSFFKYLESESSIIDLSYNYEDLSSFINYFYKIYEKYNQIYTSNGKNMTDFYLNFSEILLNTSVYSGMSSLNSMILGPEDFALIKSNPSPNSAYNNNATERINESVERTILNFQRQEIKIPTFNEILELENDKRIQVIVGNFTHPCNLTHGERTGSCMRVGGAGFSLYNFCLENPYGFHIRFEDLKTGEYISRVSGFRNGNTIFLNELRYSCNPNLYSNKDIVLACYKVANLLIEKSKDSSLPIDNVVISHEYAMKEVEAQIEYLGVDNIKKGLGSFYTDVNSNCVVLATNCKDLPFKPLYLDNTNVPTYLTCREKVKESFDVKSAIFNINRIHLINKRLKNEKNDFEEPIIIDNLIYAIYNQDWYIYVDSDLKIHEERIEIDERSKEELLVARKKVLVFVNSKKILENEVYHAI